MKTIVLKIDMVFPVTMLEGTWLNALEVSEYQRILTSSYNKSE